MEAIVVVTGRNGVVYETPFYHGVFKDGDSASAWGFKNCPGLDWHWEEIYMQIHDDGSARIE